VIHGAPPRILGVVVFTGGAGTLAAEIAASRLLAPYFGSSTIVWANIIGLILLYLSVGYWIGGRVADRRPDSRLLGGIMIAAAATIAVLPFVSRPFLDVALRGFDAVSVGTVVTSFFTTLLIFAVPITLLGTVSPFAIRLAITDLASAGSTAGRLYALSTIGSILGTFSAAIVAIPLLGTQRTMIGTAALLAFAGALLRGRRWQVATAALAAMLLVPAGTIKATDGLLYEAESAYQYVQVVERSDGSRVLQLNEGVAVHSIWRRDTVLTGGVWDTFLLFPPLLDRPPRRVLILGNAGGTVSRAFGALYPDARVDGVELDPVVSEAARRYMGLDDNPRLEVITADARPYLALTDRTYDLIIGDAYRQPYIPFYLTTQEFFELAHEHLRPGGIVALNVAAVPGDDALAQEVSGTLRAVFPAVWRWRPLEVNEIVFGLRQPIDRAEMGRRLASAPQPIQSLVPLFRDDVRPAAPSERPLTDDRAPVEWLTDRMITTYIAHGGDLDEDPLPTQPQ
jgi:spermidine synthase